MLFHSLSLEAFCHATEDLDRVKGAILSLVPFEVNKKDFLVQKLDGSFGNEIITLRLEFKKQGEVNKLVEFVKEKVKLDDIDSHITDDGRFWVRFDKQKAFEGDIELGGEDTIQMKGKVAAFPAKREKAVKLMKEFFN